MRTCGFRGLLLAASLAATAAHADELPVALQIQLLSNMTTYIANMRPPDGSPVKVVVVQAPAGTPTRSAQSLFNALQQAGKLGGFKVEPRLLPFADAKALAAALAAEKAQVVYLTSELNEKAAAGVVEALGTSGTVSVSSVADHVRLGVVLGFSLVEARPRILVNLKQAAKQAIKFDSGLLRHAVIVDR